MLGDPYKKVSPTRTYVAVCAKTDFDGHYFRRFKLPEQIYGNNAQTAAWWFLNRVDLSACIDGVVTAEDFANVKDVE